MKPFFPMAILLLVTVLSCKRKKDAPQRPQGPQQTIVDVIVANPQSISNTIEANGSVIAGESVELRPEISGRITYLNVAEGARVGKGAVVARINDADLRAQLNKVRVQLDLAETTVERYKKLLDIQGINRADYDIALNQVNSLQADIGILQAELTKTVVRAPFSGVMGLRMVSNGAYVTPASIIATMQQVEKVKIDFTLPESYANVIKKGSQVQVETDRNGGTRRRATILAIEPQISTTTRNLIVRAALNGTGISPGSFVKVYIEAGEASGILVPANAIIPDAKAKQVVVVKDGKANFTQIETGVRKEGSVQVTSGLYAGDTVVVSGVLFARPNAPLKVRSVKQLADVIQ